MATEVIIEKVLAEDEKYFGQVRIKNDENLDFHDPNSIIVMKNIHKTYLLGIEGVPALRGVSMSIKRGEFVCIFGTSGGGKTTMLNIIGTIDKPTKGDMKLCGKMINHKTTDKDLAFLRLKHIGFVFQTFNLLSSLTAIENVEMPMILLGELSASERRERATSLLTKVGMKDRLDHFPSQLSGGEQQRVTIARAIANNPEVILLDEPTGDLDTVNTSIIMKLLTDLNKNENITLVMVTHDVGLKMYSDRIIWMRDGKIQRFETVPKLKQQEQFQKLYREVENIHQNQKNGVTSVYVDMNVNKGKTTGITEYRRPSDYKSQTIVISPILNSNNNNNNSGNSSSSSHNNINNYHTTTTTTTSSSNNSNSKEPIINMKPTSPSLNPFNIDIENRFAIENNRDNLLVSLGDDNTFSPFKIHNSNNNSSSSKNNHNQASSSSSNSHLENDVFLQMDESSSSSMSQLAKDIERIL